MARIKMNKKYRILLASFIAPLSVFALPALSSMVLLSRGPDIGDDAPYRLAGSILFILVPIGYIIVGLIMAAMGKQYSESPKLSLRNLIIGSTVLAGLGGVAVGLSQPFGIKDKIIGFGLFSTLTSICLWAGVLTWWLIAKPAIMNKQNGAITQPSTQTRNKR